MRTKYSVIILMLWTYEKPGIYIRIVIYCRTGGSYT